MRGLDEPVLLDEWQHVPGVLGAVRRAVDASPRPGRFLLTGSARGELGTAVWPATGRILPMAMFPMTVREQAGSPAQGTWFDARAESRDIETPADVPDLRGYVEHALRSGFPTAALLLSGQTRDAWLEGYIDNLLTRDVDALAGTGRHRDAARLRRYFEAYALNSAGSADHATIFRAADLNHVTATAYESLLSDLFVVDRIGGWETNRLQRLVRTPKRYVVDPALLAAALRVDVDGVLRDGDLLGRILDTFVAAQLRPELEASRSRPRLHHLRTHAGRQEVDLVAELGGGRIIAIEVKAAAAPGAGDARHLRWLRDALGDRFVAGVVLHTGPCPYELDHRIVAAPIATLWA